MGRRSTQVRRQRELRDRLAREREAGAKLGQERGCLVCRRTDQTFTSVEHVVPESMGNHVFVLPYGVVCDKCNNGPLAKLDQTISEFMPIMFRRTMLGIPSKSGTVPTTRMVAGTMRHLGPGSIRLEQNTSKAILSERERYPDGKVALRMEASGGRRMTARYASELSRALLKMALEFAWLDHGTKMLDARWDHVREAILGQPRDGFFATATDGYPDHVEGTLTYDMRQHDGDDWRLVVVAMFFGVEMSTDSRTATVEGDVPPEAYSLVPFTSADLTR